MNQKESQELTTIFWRYLWSSILISLSASIGTIVNGIIVGNLIGESGVSAINLTTPLLQFMFTISLIVASGAGILIGFALGTGDMKRVRNIYSLSMGGSLVIGLLFTLTGIFYTDTVTGALCQNEELFVYTKDYLRNMLLGAPAFMMVWAVSTLIGVDGSPRLASLALVIDTLVNLCLGFVFMHTFHWGIAGSSAATVTGHIVGILVMCYHFYGKNNHLHFTWKPQATEWKNIISQGAPLAIASICLTLLLLSANHIFLNTQGEHGLFIFAICMNLLQIYNLFLAGTCRTLQSLGAIQIGKKDKEAFRLVLNKSFMFITISMLSTCLLISLFPGIITRVFGSSEPSILAESNHVLRIFAVSFIPFCYIYFIMIVYKLYKQDQMALFISFTLSLTVIPVLWIISHFVPELTWYSYLIAYLLEIIMIVSLHKMTRAKFQLAD